ncbi:redoxin domain-containing protein [Emcibacter sp. SYSU 3D8]|uniref:redoxin domain-containing protein n=1 Tax=Emcibacter sp. SYSU 3D8 TaxID=3133969 RepID=UPI0031FEAFB4
MLKGKVRAPEIDRPGLEWFNVERPLSLKDLEGKIVLLDFWTFCCINCIHVLPTLAILEEAFPEEVVVIGVHSPKFEAEKDSANLRQAIARYGITHPVIQDPEHVLWQQYAVRAWPTIVFLAPDGTVLGQTSGEPSRDKLLRFVADLLQQAAGADQLRPSLLALAPEPRPAGALSFPGKMRRIPGTALWALADSGHNQIALLDEDGEIVRRFGSGANGFDDGTAEDASFSAPQGLACGEAVIYVADTGNHALRRIDMDTGTVETLAGTGQRGMILGGLEDAAKTALASPWDLVLAGDAVYFANAGTHQLGVLDLSGSTIQPIAGSGAEDIADGPALEAALAQPSGLAISPDHGTLYFADSETSSIRAVGLREPRMVSTLVGAGLFEFGHVNGPFAEARLQHALGIDLLGDGSPIVADSYNGAIRVLDLAAGEVSDLDDGTYTCTDTLCIPAAEPAGVTVAEDGRIFLVDTNNHRVLVYHPENRTYRTWAA